MAKILIADDEPGMRILIEQTFEPLEDRGVVLLHASNGKQALEIIKTEKPDLVLLDVMMPGINGFEVCDIVKNKLGMKDVYILMLTAKGQGFDMQMGKDVGADSYITKPFDLDEVLEKVVEKVPPPKGDKEKPLRALIFDSEYDSYKGAIAYVRIVDGEINKGKGMCRGSHAEFNAIGNAAFNGVSIKDASMIVAHLPCYPCAKQIVNAHLKEVFYIFDYERKGEAISVELRPSNRGTEAYTVTYAKEGVGIPLEVKLNESLGYTMVIVKGGFILPSYEPFAYDDFGNIAQAKEIRTVNIPQVRAELEELVEMASE